jgi:hypothetical protein
MSMILCIILILLLSGALPTWPTARAGVTIRVEGLG